MSGVRSIWKDAHGSERMAVDDAEYLYTGNGWVLRFSAKEWANLGEVTDRDAALALIDADRTARAAAILRGEA